MATLKDLKIYLESGPLGRKVALSEIKELSEEERADLLKEYKKLSEDELEGPRLVS